MTVTHLPSIQGEATLESDDPGYATDSEVDKYVDSHSDGVVECRMERRHPFPLPRRNEPEFSEIDRDGNFIALYQCARCGLAWRREVWTSVRRRKAAGDRRSTVRWQLLHATVIYKDGPDGEKYLLPPGMGRAKPVQFRESAMSAAMAGQTPAQLARKLKRAA